MSIQRVCWENGLKLDSEILSKSDSTLINRIDTVNYLPYNLQKGITSFELDLDSLKTGLILVNNLKLYLDDKKYVYYDKSYPLSLQAREVELAAIITLYINIHEKVVEIEQVKYLSDVLSLSTESDFTAKYSVKISTFRSNNSSLEPLSAELPLLSMNHYLLDSVFVKVNKVVSSTLIFNQFVFSVSRPYASTYLKFLLMKLERELYFAESNKVNIHPYDIFSILHDVYSLLVLNMSEDDKDISFVNIHYDFNNAHRQFSLLLCKIEEICENRSINNFVQFHLQGGKYICHNFPEEFFIAERFYLVIKKKYEIESDRSFDNKNRLRITSISRYTNIVTLSLSGVKLEEISSALNSSFVISLNKYDKVYEIKKNSEWDFILADKSAVFSAHEGSESFDFFIAFV